MTFLLDTDICIYFLRGHDALRAKIDQVGRENIAISVVTLVELRYGVESSAEITSNHRVIDAFVEGIAVLGVDDAIARRFGQIKAPLRTAGNLIPDLDLLIAATALAHNITLVTNNTSHFARIAGLSLENWLGRDKGS